MGVETALIGSALIGAGTSAHASSQQKKAQKKQDKKSVQAGADMRRAIAPSLALGEHYTGKAMRAGDKGYDEAERQVSRSEGMGLRDLRDERTRAAGEITSGLQNSGLYNTTVAGNAQRGLSSSYARSMTDFQTRMGALRAEIARQRAATKASGLGQLAQFQAFKSGALSGTFGAQNAQASQPVNFQYQQPDFSGLGAYLALSGGQQGASPHAPAASAYANQTFGAASKSPYLLDIAPTF